MSNSQENELRRERRSLVGKVNRRYVAIGFARNDINEYTARVREIDAQLAEYKEIKKQTKDMPHD